MHADRANDGNERGNDKSQAVNSSKRPEPPVLCNPAGYYQERLNDKQGKPPSKKYSVYV
ncbi:hypothetical protein [Kaarinaea lacus]